MYLNNRNVPAILCDQFNQGFLSENEFNRKAEDALQQLEVLQAQEDEEWIESCERSKQIDFEQSRGVETIYPSV